MTPNLCANGCHRAALNKFCASCLEGDVPQPEPSLCSDLYLTACALELIHRGKLDAALAEAAKEAAEHLRSMP